MTITPWDGHFFAMVASMLPEKERRGAEAGDPSSWRRGAYYEWLVAAGAALRPQSILELGVKVGCGGAALAFGAASAGMRVERYLGIDNLRDTTEENLQAAEKILGRWIPIVQIKRVNLHDLASIDGKWDLAFLDAEHTDDGTRKQIELAASVTNTILVDDCLEPIVNRPVVAAQQPGGLLAGWTRDWLASITGIALLRRP